MNFKDTIRFISKVIYYPKIIYQILVPKSIPLIIINYNQLFYLKQLIDFALKRKLKNIIIIDNNSSYPPLLEYYDSIQDLVTIERRNENSGHMVLFSDSKYIKKYCRGFFILTDADIVPNENLDKGFLRRLMSLLFKYYDKVDKVGFALKISDIPEYYPLKEKVVSWEEQFWEVKLDEDVYLATIDTTFALYKPLGRHSEFKKFYSGVRLGGNYTATHGGWYINPNEMTEENKYYFTTANTSSSWRFDQNKELSNEFYNNMYKK